MKKLSTALVTAAAGLAIAVSAAPSAAATPDQDVRFLRLLTSRYGLQFESADIAISQGKAICSALDNGMTLNSVANTVRNELDLTRPAAQWVVASSVVVYCPWQDPTGGSSYAAPERRTSLTANAPSAPSSSTTDAAR
jgi:hypothetical protein